MQSSCVFKFLTVLLMTAFLAACAGTTTQERAGEFIDDTVLTTRIKAALVKYTLVSAIDVGVERFKGALQLIGFVKTDAERDRAIKVANGVPGVPGVTQVFNSIQIR